MNFDQLLTTFMLFLFDNLIAPINDFILQYGSGITELDSVLINLGLGDVTWFTLSLSDITLIVIGFMVSITALVLTWKFIKFLNGLLKGLFTGIKR